MRSDQYSMTLSKRCIFISIFHYLIFNLANCKCQESFQCGPLGSLKFPFSNMQRDCGLFMVNCNSPTPRVQLEDGEPYLILQKLSENKFRIRDTLETWDCTIFRKYQYLLHTSPSSSTTISYPNSTLLKCPAGLSNPLLDDYFSARNYSRYSCPDFMYYWRRSSADGEIASHQPCIKMPLQIIEYWEAWNKIRVSMWIVEFDVELNVSDACLKCHQRGGRCGNNSMNQFLCTRQAEWSVSEACYECYYEGGQCLTDNMNGFYCRKGNRRLKKIFLIGGVTAFISTSIVMFLFIWRKYTPRRLFGFQKAKPGNEKDIELFLKNNGNHAPKRYIYSEIKKMTKSFSENLGKGGYGSVYKGKLPDGRLVAVKILNESKGNGEEFMNEVATISRTSHINIVTLYGFCFEGSKRALIYEFMTNGSLDKFIQNTPSSVVVGVLGWQKLSEIALGIARGLEYLHQGCNTRILHFDIKPHNILLDEDFNPRISDFGLAKLCPNRSSIVSMLVARGTIGYIAPEVFCRNFGEVSHKSDVYSYGMMVLEIAGVKKTIDPGDVNCSSETYFPHYVYKQLEMDGERDDGIMVEDEKQLAWRKLIIVGLWCIQTDPKDRPSMTKVVEMLEGQLESLRVPPKPYLSSHPTSAPQFSFSESV